MLGKLRSKLLEENKGLHIRLIFANGFQMPGRLADYDENDMLIETKAYESSPVLVPHSAVSTLVPAVKK